MLNKKLGKNLLITGSPGIGKTAATKWVLRELEEKGLDEQVKPVYVNCWKKDTMHKLLLEICNQIGYKWVHNKKSDELFKEVCKILNLKSAVIVLDEVDKLESEQVIYQLLEELNRKCLFLITNEKEWLASLDQRLLSRLLPESLEFKPYNFKETHGILKLRAEHAFAPKVWQDEAFDLIVQKAHELQDIRAGLYLLRESGNIAESQASRKIDSQHVKNALNKLNNFKPIAQDDLSDDEKVILNLVKEHDGKAGTDIYTIYKKDNNKSYRTFYRKVKSLADNGMIKIVEHFTENGGRRSILKYNG